MNYLNTLTYRINQKTQPPTNKDPEIEKKAHQI